METNLKYKFARLCTIVIVLIVVPAALFCRNSNGLRTTSKPQKAYWVLGGDANGAMYGGLQIAENIQFNKFEGTYNN